MDEKVLPGPSRRFNAVGFCLTAVRCLQWSSSFFVFGSFRLLYDHVQKNKLGEHSRMKAVEILGLVSLIYTTVIICGVHICKTLEFRVWRIFGMVSLPGDLAIMGLCIAKLAILSFSGLPADCHGLTRDNYDGNDLVRQPAEGYSTIRFGSWTTATTGELDRLCTFPRTVYALSVVAIFSYTFSLLLSVLHLQQQQQHHKQEPLDSEKLSLHPNSPRPTLRYVGEHMTSPSTHAPSILDLDIDSRPPSPGHGSSSSSSSNNSHHAPSRAPSPRQGSTRSTRTSSTSSRTSSWGGITLGTSDTDSVRSGGSLPPAPLPGSSTAPQRRWSTSTSSSFNANAFIVTDGFRPAPPPAYQSRPGSLYNETMKYPADLGLPGMPKQ